MYIDRGSSFGAMSLHETSKVEDYWSCEDAETGKSGVAGMEHEVKILEVLLYWERIRRLKRSCELLNGQKINLGIVVSTLI